MDLGTPEIDAASKVTTIAARADHPHLDVERTLPGLGGCFVRDARHAAAIANDEGAFAEDGSRCSDRGDGSCAPEGGPLRTRSIDAIDDRHQLLADMDLDLPAETSHPESWDISRPRTSIERSDE